MNFLKYKLAAVLIITIVSIITSCNPGNKDQITTDSNIETNNNKGNGEIVLDIDEKGSIEFKTGGTSTVDLSVREGVPLFKRQSYFVHGSSKFQTYTPALLEMRSRTARFSLPIIGGGTTESATKYMRSTMREVSGFGYILRKYTSPLWHVAYVEDAISKDALANDPLNAKWYEPDYDIFNSAWKTSAKYMSDNNLRSLYEIWNEPDQKNFMTYFDWDGYIRLYENTAKALREGDSDAFVGGPALSDMGILGYDNYVKFINSVNTSYTALDFISAHYYGNSPTHTLDQLITELRKGLGDGNKTTQLIFTEFNTHIPDQSEWSCAFKDRTDFKLQTTKVIPETLRLIKAMNSYTDVTQIQWAYLFNENGSLGMIDPYGKKSPLYHVMNLYAHMPVESVKSSVAETAQVSLLASADDTNAGIMLWNESETKAQNLSLGINNVNYSNYTVSVYRIDSKHSSYYETGGSDELELVEQIRGCDADTMVWEGIIPANGVLYISITTDEQSKLERHSSVGTICRTDNYFKDRTQNSYSDFDDLTSTAMIGTGENDVARGLASVTYYNIADTAKVSGKFFGTLSAVSENSCLAVRVDYHTENGYTKSVMYTSLYPDNDIRIYPFGTCKKPDVVIKITDMSSFNIEIKKNAPAGWSGKVIVSFDIEDTGKWTEAQFILT